jgi:hypothetical protein
MIPKIIQFNSHLFTCKLNSPEANYKISMSKKNETKKYKQNTKQGSLYSNNNNNSIKYSY